MNTETQTWYADGTLRGAGAVRASVYPFDLELSDSRAAGAVLAALKSPVEEVSAGARRISQPISLTFAASEDVACEISANCIPQLADHLAFLTSKPIEVDMGPVTTAPPGAIGGLYRRISRDCLAKNRAESAYVQAPDLQMLLALAPDDQAVGRALRWLRRSYTTDDFILTFTALAFGLEALATRVATPKAGLERASAPTQSERLRHLAVVTCGVPVDAWRYVGGIRDKLFHGGFDESDETIEKVAFAASLAEYVLICGVKTLLGISSDAPPHPEKPGGWVTDGHLTVFGPAEHMRLGETKY